MPRGLKGPRIIVFCVTYRCNCRCIMCSVWRKQDAFRELSLEEVDRLFDDELLSSSLEVLDLGGGESTLRPDLAEVARIVLEKCPNLKRIDIPTNGINTWQIVDQVEKVIALAIPLDVKTTVSVSLDGVGEVHDEMRGIPGAFQKTTTTIKELKELEKLYWPWFSVGASATITSANFHRLDELLDFSNRNNFGISFTPSAISEIYVESVKAGDGFQLNDSQKETVVRFYEHLLERGLVDRFYGRFVIELLKTGRRRAKCAFREGKSFILDVNGDVYCCGNFSEFKLGNVRDENFNQVWLRRNTDAIKENFARRCRHCESNCYILEVRPFKRMLNLIPRARTLLREIGRVCH